MQQQMLGNEGRGNSLTLKNLEPSELFYGFSAV